MALVGATGSGKTTVTALVPRLHDVTGGQVLVGGVDVRDLRLEDLRHAGGDRLRGRHPVLGERPREPGPGSVRYLRRGRRGGDRGGAGRIRLRAAVRPGHQDRRAGAVAVRRATPAAGAGARGARPTAACWSWTTRCPRWTCTPRPRSRRRCGGCWPATTALVVAHRPSTVLLADRVALLADGRIAAVGTHRELLDDRAGLPRPALPERPSWRRCERDRGR